MAEHWKRSGVIAVIALVAACVLSAPSWLAYAQSRNDFEVRSVSTRADVVSGGSALVQMRVPASVAADKLSVTLNGRDVRSAFRPGFEPNILLGLVTGLQVGRNQLDVAANGKSLGKLALTNFPITGPVISGPHQTPFICETEALGMGPALDANCTVNTKVDYFYRSTDAPPPAPAGGRGGAGGGGLAPLPGEAPGRGSGGELAALPGEAPGRGAAGGRAAGGGGGRGNAFNPWKPFDPNGPRPADLAMTTTTEGKTVPYIVRREMGTINRAVYSIAILHQPGQPLPSPWVKTNGWNGKLVYSFGPGCGAGYHQGRNAGGLNGGRHNLEDGQIADYGLAKGYALAGASLNAFGTTCADLISAETMMMVKEHFVEEFGPPRYTIGSGRSGGSMQQHLIANNYPGLLDGIIPTASFADTITFDNTLFDCELLDRAFTSSSLAWTMDQKKAVAGFATYEWCTNNGTRYPNLRAGGNFDQQAIKPGMVYHTTNNPKGARFTYQDNMVNVFGRDPKTGFARRPFDNVGVQYGLGAFNEGKIGFEQFLDLNTRAGGHDIDGNVVAQRTAGDADALRIAYQTGRVNDGSRGMAAVPIIDMRPYTDGTPDVHDGINTYVMRARLMAANGTADNQVLHTYTSNVPTARAQAENLDLMDKWLDAIAGDTRAARTPLEKIVRNKPADATDACYTADLQKITDRAKCKEMYPFYSNPRLAAGAPLTNDRLKCELKGIDRRDYKQPLTDAQFAGLKTVFPQGVCDYSKKGVGQRAPETWLSYPRPGESTGLERSTN